MGFQIREIFSPCFLIRMYALKKALNSDFSLGFAETGHYVVNTNTVELQWLELMSVNHSTRSGGMIGIYFRFSFNMKVCCLFSLELPDRGDSN